MNKKAVSPLIATVLIIGFTIVLAAMVMQWGGGFVRQLTEEQGKTATKVTECMQVNIEMVSAEATVDVVANPTANPPVVGTYKTPITFTVTNNADKEITGFISLVQNSDGTSESLDSDGTKTNLASDATKDCVLGAYATAKCKIILTEEKPITLGNSLKLIPMINGQGCNIETAKLVEIKAPTA